MFKKQFSLLFVFILLLFSLSSCSDGNTGGTNNEDTNPPKQTVALTEENIDDYFYYTYIYTFNNLTETRHGIEYKAYILDINFYPKKQNVKFENCVVSLGKFVDVIDYTYTVYINENGNGQLKDQVWVQVGWEKEGFTKQYYSIQGNALIY